MKRILFSVAAVFCLITSVFSQQVQFTMVASDASTLMIYFRPDANIGPVTTGISNTTFVLQIPQTEPDPSGAWTVIPNPAYLGAPTTTTTTSSANGPMYNTLFSFTSNPNINGTSFAANTEYLLATIEVPAGVTTTDVTMTDWGNNRINNAATGAPLWATSLAVDGQDVTNDAVIFYDNPSTTGAVNSGSATQQSTLSIGTPLVVNLVSFTGKLVDNQVKLEWTANAEEGIDKYVVEHSIDALDWQTIGYVDARNKGHVESNYILDHMPRADAVKLYYRLRIIEKSGSYSYRNTVNLQRTNAGSGSMTSVYPAVVAAGADLTLQFPASDASVKRIEIRNMAGQLVGQLAASSETKFSINTTGLAAGTYVIMNRNDQYAISLKFIVL